MSEIEDLEKKLGDLKVHRRNLELLSGPRLISLREKKRQKWLDAGYNPGLIGMALAFADEWVVSLAKTYLPGRLDMQREMVEMNYSKALDSADRWIKKMSK